MPRSCARTESHGWKMRWHRKIVSADCAYGENCPRRVPTSQLSGKSCSAFGQIGLDKPGDESSWRRIGGTSCAAALKSIRTGPKIALPGPSKPRRFRPHADPRPPRPLPARALNHPAGRATARRHPPRAHPPRHAASLDAAAFRTALSVAQHRDPRLRRADRRRLCRVAAGVRNLRRGHVTRCRCHTNKERA